MNPPYSTWVERWKAAQASCVRLAAPFQSEDDDDEDDDFFFREPELTIRPPASLEDVARKEAELGVALPSSFRAVVTEFSAEVDMFWFLPEGIKPPGELAPVFCGDCSWSLAGLLRSETLKANMLSGTIDVNDPLDRIWLNKLNFADVATGDVLAIDLNDGAIVYLNHSNSVYEGHGYRLGNDFMDFVERWSLIGCPGYEFGQMKPFLNDLTSGPDLHGENAQLWRQWFGLNA